MASLMSTTMQPRIASALQASASPRCVAALPRRRQVACWNKGFGAPGKTAQTPKEESESATPAADAKPSTVDELEAQIKNRRKGGKIEPKVKVQSAIVDAVTGKTPAPAGSEMETLAIQGLFGLFGIIITEGLVLAGSGFLPEEADAWVQDTLYPSYSPTVLLFLGCSSLYGLWKTGKLPGQQQQQ